MGIENRRLNILLYSPFGFAINVGTRYSGIERLVWEFSFELNKLGHKVSVIARADSAYPEGVIHLSVPVPSKTEDIFSQAEMRAFHTYSHLLRTFDVVHDFSHQHFASRYMPKLPSLNIFWHAPSVAKFPKSPYNIIGLSKWACREFERVYRQAARYQRSIPIDTETYKPPDEEERGTRFLTLGLMAPHKGNLETARLTKALGLPLDIAGKEADEDYVKQIRSLCDDKLTRYWGEVTDKQKLYLLQFCKALIYMNSEPEVTSHKAQEAMLCGAPVIVSNIGALPEIVTQGVNGYLCNDIVDFTEALLNVDKLHPLDALPGLRQTWGRENIVKDYIPLYEQVAKGLRW